MKQCKTCSITKEFTDFYIDKGRPRSSCKDCEKQDKRNYYSIHKEKILEQHEQYRKTEEYHIVQRKYQKNYLKTNPNAKLRRNLRRRLHHAIKNDVKIGSAVRDLGCSITELKQHLESKFQPGMTWENYGPFGWHIDHIKPLISFNLNNIDEFFEAVNFKNLQPLWAEENWIKNAKIS